MSLIIRSVSISSYWNYRVVKYRVGDDEVFEVFEVYYDHDIPNSSIPKNSLNKIRLTICTDDKENRDSSFKTGFGLGRRKY